MRRTVVCVVGLLVGLTAPGLGVVGAPGAGEAFELTAGVVVDPARATLFMMNPAGGIDSVSVRTGELLWSSDRAAKPLGLVGDRLVAQVEKPRGVGGLEIAWLDAVRGVDEGQRLTIDLPGGIHAGVDDGLGTTFRTRSASFGGRPHLRWEHVELYMKGVAPGPEDTLETRNLAAYQLDLAANRAVQVDATIFEANGTSLPASLQAVAGPGSTPILRAGSVLAATELRGNSSLQEIVLKRWDATTGAALPDVTLFSGEHVAQLRSVDHAHLLIAERVAPGEFDEYEWSIFSLESGKRLGKVSHHRGASRFFVTDNMLTWVESPYGRLVGDEWTVESRKLKTILLGSAAQVWERELRDTDYRGPFPP